MKKLNLFLLVAGLLGGVSAIADTYQNFDLTENGHQVLAVRALLGLTEQAGFSGTSIGRIMVCGQSPSGTGVVALIENADSSLPSSTSPSITMTPTVTCYNMYLPTPGQLDVDVDRIQLDLTGDFVITGIGAYAE